MANNAIDHLISSPPHISQSLFSVKEGAGKSDLPAPIDRQREQADSSPREFTEVLESQLILREHIRKMEEETGLSDDQTLKDAANSFFHSQVSEEKMEVNQGLSILPTLSAFEDLFSAPLELGAVEIKGANIDSGALKAEEGEANLSQLETLANPLPLSPLVLENQIKSRAREEKIASKLERDALSLPEDINPKIDPLEKEEVKKEEGNFKINARMKEPDNNPLSKNQVPASSVDNPFSPQKQDTIPAEQESEALKITQLAKEIGGQNPESQKLAQQLNLGKEQAPLKVKITQTPASMNKIDQPAMEAILETQEEESFNASDLLKNDFKLNDKFISGQLYEKMEKPFVPSEKETLAGAQSAPSLPKSAESTDSPPSQPLGDFTIQAQPLYNKPQNTTAPIYAASQQAALLPQLAQGIMNARQEGINRFFIQMQPPKLGVVEIALELKEGRMKAIFSAKKETLNLLKEHSQTLKESLQKMGIDVEAEGFEFTLAQGQTSNFEHAETLREEYLNSPLSRDGENSPPLPPSYRVNLNRVFDEVA